jgi:hypothetical protein
MEIRIVPGMTVGEVKEQFSKAYPHLKLEFYSRAHSAGEGSADAHRLADDTLLAEAAGTRVRGEVHLHGNMKTATLEKELMEEFGLHVQVFRLSGKLWLQTTKTDDWTLGEQERTASDMQK